MDNTFATSLNQQPLAFGATVSLQSATKFIGGLLAGVTTTNDEVLWHALTRCLTINDGFGTLLAMQTNKQTSNAETCRRPRYPSDMTDAEWTVIAPHFAPTSGPGAPRTVDTRAVFDAIWYRLRTGCQWRRLPIDFPAWPTVYYYFRQWGDDGTLERLNAALRRQVRIATGRDPEPSAGIIDSQTIKTTEAGSERGFDGGKKSAGPQTSYRG